MNTTGMNRRDLLLLEHFLAKGLLDVRPVRLLAGIGRFEGFHASLSKEWLQFGNGSDALCGGKLGSSRGRVSS